MPRPSVVLDEATIVVKGRFNAAIFSPLWFRSTDLISAEDLEDSEVEVITPDFAKFRCGWLSCLVTPDSMQLSATDPAEFERVRDASAGVLNTLRHTPIGAMGVNRTVHIRVASAEQLNRVGDTLAPKSPWLPALDFPALRAMTMWGVRPDSWGGRVQVVVEPSNRVHPGIFIAHNDHFTLARLEERPHERPENWSDLAPPATEPSPDKIPAATEILRDEFQRSIERSNGVIAVIDALRESA